MDLGTVNTLTRRRLPHPIVDPASLQVYLYEPPTNALTATTKWALDSRNGLVKFSDTSAMGKGSVVAGQYFTWFSDEELAFHMRNVVAEHSYGRPSLTEQTISLLEWEVIQMGTVVHALWSLCVELALDIDVSTPEGMFIPARQRYAQAWQMMQYYENEYNTRAAELNIGLGSLDVYRLRRVAYMTNRYVPVYEEASSMIRTHRPVYTPLSPSPYHLTPLGRRR